MNKEIIIKEKISLVDWALSLKNMSNELWFKSFREGSWGTADVISHLISWDVFMIQNRIPYILSGKESPTIQLDVHDVNKEASLFARSGISKGNLINQFVSKRKELVSFLEKIPDEFYEQPCPWNEQITLKNYFELIIGHDLKHKEEIDEFIGGSL